MKKLLIATAMTLCSHAAFADVAVIVNPANGNAIDEGTIKKIYLGKAKSFDDGTLQGHGNSNASNKVAEGRLKPIAAKVLMKVLYAARMARFDILRWIGRLATFITRWTVRQDAELHRLMCYIASTLELRLVGWVGDARTGVGGPADELASSPDACTGAPTDPAGATAATDAPNFEPQC